jgi:hypothetical protein
VSEYLGLLRNRGLELCECIDTHSYKKARWTLYAGDVDQLQTVIRWLEEQPDWSDVEFWTPDCMKEEMREQEMLARDARKYERSIGETNNGNRSISKRRKPDPHAP